jgi:hypothetical protein
MLEDSCLALSDLVLLQSYFLSNLTPLELINSQTNTTSSAVSTVSTTEGSGRSTYGGQSRFEKSGSVMVSQSPPNAAFISLSPNSEIFSNRDSKFPSEQGNETEKTDLSFSSTVDSGTGSAKQTRAVSKLVVESGSDKVLFSVDIGSKDMEKFNFPDPAKVKLNDNSDIVLENKVIGEFVNEKPTSCYKG